jgi:hypothetical protein
VGELSMRPDELNGGADRFGRHAEMLAGHAQQVNGLAGLRAAFAGAGETAWPAVEAKLTELVGRLEQARERTANAGTMLSTAATGSTAIDAQGRTTIRMS